MNLFGISFILHFLKLSYGSSIKNGFEKIQKAIACKLVVKSNVNFSSDDMIIFNESLNQHLNWRYCFPKFII